MKTKTAALATVIAILAVGIAIWKLNSGSDQPNPSGQTGTSTPSEQTGSNNESSQGVITPGSNGMSVYSNQSLGLKFAFPQDWRVGANSLGNGVFQLFNYSEAEASGKSVFLPGQNKIEMRIVESNSYGTSSDYPETARTTNQVQIAGQTANKEDITLLGDDKTRVYSIPLPALQGKFVSIVIHGDPANFSALDDLVKSLVLTRN